MLLFVLISGICSSQQAGKRPRLSWGKDPITSHVVQGIAALTGLGFLAHFALSPRHVDQQIRSGDVFSAVEFEILVPAAFCPVLHNQHALCELARSWAAYDANAVPYRSHHRSASR